MSIQTQPRESIWLNTSRTFGLVSRILHWTMAILIAANIPLGFYAAYLPRTDLFREALLSQVHKPLGLLILFLVVIRIGWHLFSPRPDHAPGLRRWEVRLASLVHVGIYALMVAVPLSGIFLSQGAGHKVSFFGLFDLPVLWPVSLAVPIPQRLPVIVGAILHKRVLDIALCTVLFFHLAGVIKHHLIDGRRNEIRRMWGKPPQSQEDGLAE